MSAGTFVIAIFAVLLVVTAISRSVGPPARR